MAVLVIGTAVVDHVIATIPEMPLPSHLVLTETIESVIGGNAANIAVCLARLGLHCHLAGCIGADPFGSYLSAALTSNGVSVEHLVTTSNAPTSQTFVLNIDGQDRRYVCSLGANACFSVAHVPLDLIGTVPAVFVAGFGLLPRLRASDLAEVFHTARSNSAVTALGISIPQNLDRAAIESILGLNEVLPATDVFFLNAQEAEHITASHSRLKQLEHLHNLGASTVVITAGSIGSVFSNGMDILRAATFGVDCVDPTGAGDAFAAGFLKAMLDGGGPCECLTVGSALAASCIRSRGATTGVARIDQLNTFLKTHRLEVVRGSIS